MDTTANLKPNSFSALHQLLFNISDPESVNELLIMTISSIYSIAQANEAVIALLNEEKVRGFRIVTTGDAKPGESTAIPIDRKGSTTELIQRLAKQKTSITPASEVLTLDEWSELFTTKDNQSYLGVPIQDRNGVVGFILLASQEKDVFDIDRANAINVLGLQVHTLIRLFNERDALKKQAEQDLARLRRNLHDGLQASLTGLTYSTKALKTALEDRDYAQASQLTDELLANTEIVLLELRYILNSTNPERILNGNLASLLAPYQKVIQRIGIQLQLDVDAFDEIMTQQRETCYRIIQESLNNIAKHSKATWASVQLVRSGNQRFKLTIRDNGSGFDMQQVKEGEGLTNIRSRASQLHAELSISSQPQRGTTIEMSWK